MKRWTSVTCRAHGETYDSNQHLARYARFLPMYPELLVFESSGPCSIKEQDPGIRAINAAALRNPLAYAQREALKGAYQEDPESCSLPYDETFVPAGWRNTPRSQDFYRTIVKPYCATCHSAHEKPSTEKQCPLLRGFLRGTHSAPSP